MNYEKIAIISDIHGNKTALEETLKDIKKRQISKIYCLGDIVTKGPNPDIAIDLIRKNCEVVLKGNCDDIISNDLAKGKKYWAAEKIGKDRIEYLRNLPVMHEFYLSGQLVRLFHASPYSLCHIFNPMFSNVNNSYKDIELTKAEDMFENTSFIGKNENDKKPDIVGYGHIHTSNLFKFKNKTLFNPGSVGFSTEMVNEGIEDITNCFTTLAQYTILEGVFNSKELDSISFTNVRIPYDIEKEISYIEKSDMPTKKSSIFSLKTASTKIL